MLRSYHPSSARTWSTQCMLTSLLVSGEPDVGLIFMLLHVYTSASENAPTVSVCVCEKCI